MAHFGAGELHPKGKVLARGWEHARTLMKQTPQLRRLITASPA